MVHGLCHTEYNMINNTAAEMLEFHPGLRKKVFEI